ncbi:MAG: pre-peptidase C-terminal domain-containing protein [Sedimentisphaerales bacterium]|nr:pre-peptidase C-terminal domain-containing protein [Sedimentisphaerales bacterium]
MNGRMVIRPRNIVVLVGVLGLLGSLAYGGPVILSNGVPVSGISGAAGSEQFYAIEVPAGQDELEIRISGGTGDCDLYVRKGAAPTTTTYDYRPYKVGNNETVVVENPQAGTWHIMLKAYSTFSGLTLVATYSAETSEIPLENGVPVTNLSGAAASETLFMIEVPAGQDSLEISISGGTGDCDLYVRKGTPPTTIEYDYRPYKVGNNETVSIESPAAGTWYIMLRGYSAYAGLTLEASYSAAATITLLTNGVPVTALSAATGSELLYRIEVPGGQPKLEISISGGTGDCDLYVKKGAIPTVSDYDYRPYLFGNNETVTVNNPAAGTWYIMLRAYNAFTGLTLVASHGGGSGSILQNGVPVANLAGAASSEKMYRIEVPSGQQSLEIMMFGGTGDADLYVKFGAAPTVSAYDYRPFLAGNNETVTVSNPTAGTWYIMVRGYSEYAGVTLKATYGGVTTLLDEVPIPNISGTLGTEKLYKIELPSGMDQLQIRTSGGTGNCNVYIKRGTPPTTANYDWRLNQPTNNESISIGSPEGGTWYIMLRAQEAYTGVTLTADYWGTGEVKLLANGVPVPNISGNAGSEQFYKIQVPAGQTKLEIKMSGGTGDADMYVKFGNPPTVSQYDYRPYVIGNNETVTINNPTAGTWFIMIRAYQTFSGLTLTATYSSGGGSPTVTLLQNGVAVASISDDASGQKYYKIEVPAGQAKLEIKITGSTGDCDLYVRKGSLPTTTEWDHRPYLMGSNETVSVDNPGAGTWFIMLRGYTAYSGVTLVATYFPVVDPVTELDNGVPVPGLSGATGSEKFYKITVPAGQEFLDIEIAGGTGDCDLYVKKGTKPTATSYDYRPFLMGNNEKVEIDNPAAATWYIMLRAYSAYSGVTLVATYGPANNNFAADPNCVALWSFETVNLGLDTIGGNNLYNIASVAVDASQYQEGVSSAYFNNNYLFLYNNALAADFPLKAGTSNKNISMCFWCRPETLPPSGDKDFIGGKYHALNGRTFSVAIGNVAGAIKFELHLGYDNGNSAEVIRHNAGNLVAGRWYHVGVTYRDSDKSYRIRIWDDTNNQLLGGVETVGTASNNISLTNVLWVLGARSSANYWYNGLLDEVVVFNDILSDAEIDQIRQGVYDKP